MARPLRRLAALALILAVWQVLVSAQVIDPLFVSSPSTIVSQIIHLCANGIYQSDIEASVRRIVAGFTIGIVTSVPVGYLLATVPLLEDGVDLFLHAARSVSPLALVPLTILWLGVGETQKYVLIAITVFFPTVVAVTDAVRSVPAELIRAARTLKCRGRFKLFFHIVLPYTAPALFTAMRVGLAMAFMVIVAAEMIGANNGIGYLILNSGQNLDTSAVFAGIITVAVLGLLSDRLVLLARRRLCSWQRDSSRLFAPGMSSNGT